MHFCHICIEIISQPMKNDTNHASFCRIAVRFFCADSKKFLWKVIILSQGLIICDRSGIKDLALWMSVAEALQIIHIISLSPSPRRGIIFMIMESQFISCHSDVFRKGNRRGKKKNLMKDFMGVFS